MIPRIRLVQIKNYKSLADVSVELGLFTVLVGPNGSGKSNFVDALAFVQECLTDSLERVLSNRGGYGTLPYRIGFEGQTFGFRLHMELGGDVGAEYALEVKNVPFGVTFISRERCIVLRRGREEHRFEVRNGKFTKEIPGIRPQISSDRPALSVASAVEEFRPVYEFLSAMRFYSIQPARLRELQDPGSGMFLHGDGGNAASVLRLLEQDPTSSENYHVLCRMLAEVSSGLKEAHSVNLGPKETVAFVLDVGLEEPRTFFPTNISDGTLRALGILLAVFQKGFHPLMAIEEPEATVHPALAEMLMEILMNASDDRQVLITTHSPDLLNYKELRDDQIRLVTLSKGKSVIAPPSGALRDVIREHLCLTGELLSMGELHPDEETLSRSTESVDLFGPPFPEAHGEQ